MKLNYLMKIAKGATNMNTLKTVVNQVHERSGKNKLLLTVDVLACALIHGAGYHDYLIFGWETIPLRKRKTYLTRVRNKALMETVNDPACYPTFDQKSLFDSRFAKYLKRDFLLIEGLTEEKLAAFIEGKKYVFLKPDIGESGKGIERLEPAEFESVKALHAYITDPKKKFGVIEEELKQHPDVAKIYPYSINTMRICCIIGDDGKPRTLYATFKAGNKGKFVDNMENDGIACPVDMKTGKICGVAHTSSLQNYDEHPYTHVKLLGYQLPYVKEAIALTEQAMLEEPRMRYLGWDVAITPDGPAIIEGNNYPGYDFSQLPEHTPNRIGTLAEIKKYIKKVK